ncbi:ribosome maturation factor RimM [Lederbergia galactosidilytica]|uniref:Ribosome maturation factor RimM n=1 Tax=Lederbergia galactosidilytica TaxID=217031 RepID=A0A177ZXC1_9BACI|nr:ribosome maturation factor RimM [Lederbergia galactosidilytica]MBP1913678.1 16S rRNA processing protein RimM [Lederbergia galactosidilytica]OAK72575.1 16S rRNA processing protein RimM [Lederbergia galactosidilytica]
MEQWFNVGKIVNTHGIQGEVRVISSTDFAEQRFAIGQHLHLFLQKNQSPVKLIIKSHRKHKNFDLLSFEGYNNINDVEHWKNALLKISDEQLEDLPEGEYYFHEIIGCTVLDENSQPIGVVKEILTPGANDVWVVKSEEGKEYLIPYIDDVVVEISIEKKEILINPIEGLLDI